MISTTCEECVFAVRAPMNGNLQIGCHHQRLKTFLERGQAERVGNSYFIKRLCNLCRNRLNEHETLNEGIARVRAEIALKCDVVIVYDLADDGEDLDGVLRSLDDIKKQTLPAQNVHLYVVGCPPDDSSFLIRQIQHSDEYRAFSTLPSITLVIDLMEDALEDIVVRSVKSPYYCVVRPAGYFPPDTLKSVDCLINDNLQQVAFIKPANVWNESPPYHGTFVQTRLHNHYHRLTTMLQSLPVEMVLEPLPVLYDEDTEEWLKTL